jgi:hypothetical protein
MAITPRHVHFVCRQSTKHGFTQQGGNFTTSSWRMSDAAAGSVDAIYLHDRKSVISWAQGEVIGRRKVSTPKGDRWEFDVRLDDVPSCWPQGQRGGGPEKAYV